MHFSENDKEAATGAEPVAVAMEDFEGLSQNEPRALVFVLVRILSRLFIKQYYLKTTPNFSIKCDIFIGHNWAFSVQVSPSNFISDDYCHCKLFFQKFF